MFFETFKSVSSLWHAPFSIFSARRDADSTAKQAQVLWSACQALTRALRAGCPGIPWKEQIRPLEPELTAVEKAAGIGDELVKAVLSGIPEEAKNRGVFPEDALRERFLKVEKVARNVALVPEGGASLPVHFLSYLQGLFLLKAASPIPQAELNDEATDFSKLNTNDILQRARYWLDRGNFEQTLKYMNLLKGAPRCVARQWMNETRILLETQQAANTLMAHAASSGLNYL